MANVIASQEVIVTVEENDMGVGAVAVNPSAFDRLAVDFDGAVDNFACAALAPIAALDS